MKLLTPEEVKRDTTKADEEHRARVRGLAEEEERLIASVNALRAAEKDERGAIEGDMEQFRAEQGAERARLSAEVTSLEGRRAADMKPIDEVLSEADERNRASKEREDELGKAESDFQVLTADLKERETALIERSRDQKQEQDERESSLEEREEHLRQEEAISKESLEGLNRRWFDFHEVLAKTDIDLVARESAARADEQANTTARTENAAEKARLVQEDKAVRDKYTALEQARVHLGIK